MSKMYASFDFDHYPTCDICHIAKHRKLPYATSYLIISNSFDLLHFDIWGPLAIPSIHDHKYLFTILDDHKRFVWIILMKTKSEASTQVQNFINMVINQFHKTLKTIRSDNGLKFLLK